MEAIKSVNDFDKRSIMFDELVKALPRLQQLIDDMLPKCATQRKLNSYSLPGSK